MLRNSALLIDKKKKDKFEQLGFNLEDIFLSEQEKRKIIEENMSSLNISASS